MSRDPDKHAHLLGDLDLAMRKIGAQSVLLSQAVADRVGMNASDLDCLDMLSWQGPLTAGQLSEITGLTTGAITGVIDRLEKAGYAHRESDPNDRRRVIIRPNVEAIVRNIAPLYEPLRKAVRQHAESFSDEQLALILRFLNEGESLLHRETVRLREQRTAEPSVEGKHFSAPLGGATRGRLLFGNGSTKTTIDAGAPLTELYTADFEHPVPKAMVQGGAVSFKYVGMPFLAWREKPGFVKLNSSIPWHVQFQRGASKVALDLREIMLEGVEISGGSGDVAMKLPRPSGTVPIKLSGGASNLVIKRPAGVPVHVRIIPGSDKVSIDKEFIHSKGSLSWESPEYPRARDRYEISISGGASKVTIGTG